ncbi:hypothetical protein EK21DRAFT_109226 [Setomelanomma holmii]|uniref:Uncharacterized protein n=1 Tax=Setomelanomma holmii TaxID=210430 RepID=A0A9P4LRS9_9PLEO|nr:hypothetical protein EK21DRAFT_109226 [Setomelanomma holmii]
MRFSSITFAITALLSAFAIAAPTAANNDIAKRMPTPEEFEALAPEQKRKVYTAWYRATNIIADDSCYWGEFSLQKTLMSGLVNATPCTYWPSTLTAIGCVMISKAMLRQPS